MHKLLVFNCIGEEYLTVRILVKLIKMLLETFNPGVKCT